MEWFFCKPLESTDLIEEFEKTADFKFPETYKEYVKKYAYGRPKGMVFKTEKFGDITFRLYTFVKESMFHNIWEINNAYIEVASNLKRKREQEEISDIEALRIKNYEYIIQNYIFFATCNKNDSDLAFNRKNGAIEFVIDNGSDGPLKTEIIADSFDKFIEEKLYKRERTGVYDDIEWDYFEPLKSESLIEEYEKEINYTFPKSFKECVKKYNAANTSNYVFDVELANGETDFYFHSFNKEENSMWDVLSLYDDSEPFKNLKKNYVVFGSTFFCDFLTFNRKNGSVVYWDYETMDCETIARSFDDFLNKVHLNKEIFYIT